MLELLGVRSRGGFAVEKLAWESSGAATLEELAAL